MRGRGAIVTSRIDRAVRLDCFRWVNTILGNVKTAITGTFHALRRPYVQRYLAEFQFRFNRRHRLATMIADLARAAAATAPFPCSQIRLADAEG